MSKKPPVQTAPSALPLQVFLVLALFSAGLYYEYLSCAASVFLAVYLVYARKKQGALCLPKSAVFLTAAVIALSMAVTALWAVDRGMAPLGFAKFLPLPLFVLAVFQLSAEQRQALLQPVPTAAAVMVLVSFALGFVPAFRSFFLVNSRLSGFLGYPNVFALLLLISVVLTVSEGLHGIRRLAVLAVLLFGIFMSGSRTAFVLLLAAIVWLSIASKDKHSRRLLLGTTAVLALGAGLYVLATGNVSSLGRFVTTSFASSTFLGRLLYFKDALPVIASHPFGLGYLGYSFSLGSFQTGVYSLVNVHNELLQLLLDVGWIPAGLAVFTLIRCFVRGSSCEKLVIFVAAAHCMMDFDLQFPAVGMLLVLILLQAEKPAPVGQIKKGVCACAVVVVCISVYFGLASGLYYAGNYAATVRLCPAYTSAWEQLLLQTQDADAMNAAADEILSRNETHSLANSAKARVAYSEGDFGKVIEYKEKAIAAARYCSDEYIDYASMLQVGMQLYSQNGDSKSAEICRSKLLKLPSMVDEVINSTSPIAWKLDETPQLALPDELLALIEQLS